MLTLPLTAANGGLSDHSDQQRRRLVHIIDAATNKIVGRDPGYRTGPRGPGLARRALDVISNEADNTVDVIDSKTMKVTKKIPLSGHPNNLAITPDGRKFYVPSPRRPGPLT